MESSGPPQGRGSERLVSELHRTVDMVSSALDRAAEEMLREAEEESRKRAEAAAVRVDELIAVGIQPLRRLSDQLVQRAIELDREIERLTARATEAASALRRDGVVTGAADTSSSSAPANAPALAPDEADAALAELDQNPIFPESPLDEIAAAREPVGETPAQGTSRWRNFGRQQGGTPEEIPEGVRSIVDMLRLAGESDESIANQLRRIGVDDPVALVSRIHN
jgi:hypothetical protein